MKGPGPAPICPECRRPKKPTGRDAGLASDSYCTPHSCDWYWDPPVPSCRWPGEEFCGPGCPGGPGPDREEEL